MSTCIEYGYPEKLYHADRSAWSCSALSKWLTRRRSFKAWLDGDNVDAPTDRMTFGRYEHALIYEGRDVADARFEVAPARGGDGPDAGMLIDRKKNRAQWKAFEAGLGGREWVRPELAANAVAMLDALASHHEAGPLLFPASDGDNEVSLWWTDDATGVRLRCRFDRVVKCGGVWMLPDLKTTEDASDFAVAKTAQRFAYHMKAAMYLDAWAKHTGEPVMMPLIFVETSANPAVNVKWCEITDQAHGRPIELGRQQYRRIIREIQECQSSGDWREPFERTERAPLALPGWVMREHEFSGSDDDLEGAEEA
jgi:hypothetical protein